MAIFQVNLDWPVTCPLDSRSPVILSVLSWHRLKTLRTLLFEVGRGVAHRVLWVTPYPLKLTAIQRDFEAKVFYRLDALPAVQPAASEDLRQKHELHTCQRI